MGRGFVSPTRIRCEACGLTGGIPSFGLGGISSAPAACSTVVHRRRGFRRCSRPRDSTYRWLAPSIQPARRVSFSPVVPGAPKGLHPPGVVSRIGSKRERKQHQDEERGRSQGAASPVSGVAASLAQMCSEPLCGSPAKAGNLASLFGARQPPNQRRQMPIAPYPRQPYIGCIRRFSEAIPSFPRRQENPLSLWESARVRVRTIRNATKCNQLQPK